MLLRCGLIHITIIIMRHILCFVYLCQFSGLCLFLSYLCHLFFIFSLISIAINHITSLKQKDLFFFVCFAHFQNSFYYFWMTTRVKKMNNFQLYNESLTSGCCLAIGYFFSLFQPSVAYKSVDCKK